MPPDVPLALSQDPLPSPLPIASLSKCYYSHCTTSDVYTTPVSTTVNTTKDTVVSIAFSNTVRAERSEDRHRMTPIQNYCVRHLADGLIVEAADASVPRDRLVVGTWAAIKSGGHYLTRKW